MRNYLGLLFILPLTGCGEPSAPASEAPLPAPPTELAVAFDPAQCGTLTGHVTWQAAVPEAPPLLIYANTLSGPLLHKRQERPNPNAPLIDPRSKGIGNAIVFLRGVDPTRSKPWDMPPVQIEMREGQYHLLQGALDTHLGIARRGEAVEVVSRDPLLHSCQAAGAAFFSLPLPDPNQPSRKILPKTGVVELTSGIGYYWMRAYLLVDEHPYYARTNASGQFELKQVPAGTYEIVCWLPNWNKDRHERDPESALISRYFFQPPWQKSQRITVEPGKATELAFVLPGEP